MDQRGKDGGDARIRTRDQRLAARVRSRRLRGESPDRLETVSQSAHLNDPEALITELIPEAAGRLGGFESSSESFPDVLAVPPPG